MSANTNIDSNFDYQSRLSSSIGVKIKNAKIIGVIFLLVIVLAPILFSFKNVNRIPYQKIDEILHPPKTILNEDFTSSYSFNLNHSFAMGDSSNSSSQHDISIKTPFTCVISGPTGSGKTEFIFRLINNREFITDIPPKEIIYCYGAWQDKFNQITNVTFHEGFIDISDLPNDQNHRWVIIDDLMEEVGKSSNLLNLFTKYSHHKNISVIFVTQNLFYKNLRTITLQAHYIALFKSPRDKTASAHLGRQFYPSNPNFLVEAYEDATKFPYSYLWLDLKQTTPENMRVLGNFLSEDPKTPLTAYIPK